MQQRDASFVVDAEPGAGWITVTVNREGKTGAASGEKCATYLVTAAYGGDPCQALVGGSPLTRRQRDRRFRRRGDDRDGGDRVDGYTAQRLTWGRNRLYNSQQQVIGRANSQVLELNTVVESTGNDLDVGRAVDRAPLDRTESKLEIIDPATSRSPRP